MENAKKYSKIQLTLMNGTILEFENSGLAITGNHLIIIETEMKDNPNFNPNSNDVFTDRLTEIPDYSIGKFFKLDELREYKTVN